MSDEQGQTHQYFSLPRVTLDEENATLTMTQSREAFLTRLSPPKIVFPKPQPIKKIIIRFNDPDKNEIWKNE